VAQGAPSAPQLDLPAEPAAAEPAVSANQFGGYGEVHYSRTDSDKEGAEPEGEIDVHRFVLFFGHRFDDAWRFHSELELEHAFAGEGAPGEVELEQAYVEHGRADDAVRFRAGLVLVPFGIVNQFHEPPSFHGVERPRVDSIIIPTTWREAGVGVFGRVADISYEAYVLSGLNAAGFSADKGTRGGRTKVGEAAAGAPAFAARVAWEPAAGATIGASGYWGDAGKNVPGSGGDLSVGVLGIGADARYRAHGVEARALFAQFSLSGTDDLAASLGEAGPGVIGSVMRGGYAELGYDLLEPLGSDHELVPFVRYEAWDTTAEVADGAADPESGGNDLLLGATWRPIPQISFKADLTLRSLEEGESQQIFNLGLGYMF
jgi:hypothetical protein